MEAVGATVTGARVIRPRPQHLSRPVARLLSLLHYTETVAVRIGEDDVIRSRLVTPLHPLGTEPQQPLNLRRLVSGVEVEVVPAVRLRLRRDEFKGKLHARTRPRHEHRPVGLRLLARAVVERGTPTARGTSRTPHTMDPILNMGQYGLPGLDFGTRPTPSAAPLALASGA